MLTEEELERYKRQIIIQGMGIEGQEKLKQAKVLVAGIGGLGSPGAMYLAAAGIGHLKIIDMDTVELSNLNRQILHRPHDLNRDKVDSACEKLRELNPGIRIEPIKDQINEDNVRQLVADCDLIFDGMDNLPARYLLNRTAVEKRIPMFHGAIRAFEGRALTIIPGKSACLMCVYHGANVTGTTPAIGVTAGIIACIEATEVIKYITGMGQLLTNRFLVYDGLSMRFMEIKVARNPACPHCSSL